MRALFRWAAAIFLSAACAEVRESRAPTEFSLVVAPQGVTVYYDQDVQAIFDRGCTGGCHEPGGTGVRDSGLDLTADVSYAELFDATRSRNGPHVVAGDPDNSLLIWKVEGVDTAGRTVYGDPMPLGRQPLADADIAILRAWIQQGALRSVAPPRPPRVLATNAPGDRSVEVTFDEPVLPGSAGDAGNYRVTGGPSPVAVVEAAVASPDRVVLTLDAALSAGAAYTLSVTGVQDADGLGITTPESAEFRYTPVVSFALQLQPLFDASCAFAGCHAADDRFPPGEGLVLDAGASRAELVGVASGQRPGTLRVVVGDPDASYLIAKLEGTGITGDRMPIGGPFLTPAEVQLFRLWIEQGALGD